MNKLTKRINNVPDGESGVWVKNHDYITAAEKLADYEDLEEQGLLLRLPCKVGDTLYVPYSRPKYIKEVKVTEFLFDGVDFHIQTDFVTFSLRDIGVDLLLTESEAEEKLRKLK